MFGAMFVIRHINPTKANPFAGHIHDRMLVILPFDDCWAWLGEDSRRKASELPCPYPAGATRATLVSAVVSYP